jgi:hypothetical protein
LEAFHVLILAEKGAKVSDILEKPRNLKPVDAALLQEIVYGCTCQKRLLDHHLIALCQSPFNQLPLEVKIPLRIGLYQLLFLDLNPLN